ncbi:MAG: hypothetical protein KKB90_02185 [Actinobacteria bacterium]|nr:hypothetical protein [Actinomycetota bacterium]MCG2819797.1 hypothetical protein [Actinomycetes bacterium]MBU4217755.1 hypothetical protein [Actinomycetota bacterium]MBU4357986.1 hypothetical protein [Actinomycetota bacterium]MBU4391805.1 hypothetical protein [Actinomycetota bacterium]
MYTVTMWPTIGVIAVASAFLCMELAKKKHRDKAFYFVVGGLIGPLGVLVVMTPLPTMTAKEAAAGRKLLRVVKRTECPACHQKVYAGERQCCQCGHVLGTPWWERPALYNRKCGR